MFARLATSALFAGAGAGLIAAILQLLFVQPVLLNAELYESGQLTHFGTGFSPVPLLVPAFDPLRDGLSVVFSMLIYSGYALVLVAAMSLAEQGGARVDGRVGLIWGVAGFVAAHLAPAFSLPPEVPGMASADVQARQIWWFATVLSAAGAAWLIAFARAWIGWGAAAVLLLAPHLIGAPQATEYTGPVPPELASLFAARALGVGFAAWLLLGCFAGYFWCRESARDNAFQGG